MRASGVCCHSHPADAGVATGSDRSCGFPRRHVASYQKPHVKAWRGARGTPPPPALRPEPTTSSRRGREQQAAGAVLVRRQCSHAARAGGIRLRDIHAAVCRGRRPAACTRTSGCTGASGGLIAARRRGAAAAGWLRSNAHYRGKFKKKT